MAVAGRYKALRKIADGGTAEVFLAEQVGAAGFRRLVVLKRIRSQLYADPQFRRILIEEAHVTMGLHHSNLVEVLDLGEAQGRYFLVLELVDGWTLEQLLKRAAAAGHPVPPELAVYLVTEVCRALGYAHDRTRGGTGLGIVHRDVCPNNVLVSDTAEVKLTDFGIAKARIRTPTTQVGTVAGKPSYMSPEQACGEPVDARSDLFSLGTLLYYLLTGELPFKAPSDRELMIRVASGEFVSPGKRVPSLPKDLVKLSLEAMKREPKDRFQTAQQMLAALEKVARSALPPFGRTELEAWLRALAKKDGNVPVTRESMAPAAVKEEWIELSADDLKALPENAAPGRGLGMIAAVVLVALTAGVAWWFVARSPLPPRGEGQGEGPERALKAEPPAAPVVIAPAAVMVAEGEPAPAEAEPQLDAAVLVAVAEPAPAEAGAPAEEPLTPALSPRGEREPAEVVPPAVPSPPPAVPAAEAPPLKVFGRLDPSGTQGDRLGVLLSSDPPGASVKVDRRALGTTPTTLRFKSGITFEVTFTHEGHAPLVQWLTLVERGDRPPRVQLKAPPPK